MHITASVNGFVSASNTYSYQASITPRSAGVGMTVDTFQMDHVDMESAAAARRAACGSTGVWWMRGATACFMKMRLSAVDTR
jgi:hypothetical protein